MSVSYVCLIDIIYNVNIYLIYSLSINYLLMFSIKLYFTIVSNFQCAVMTKIISTEEIFLVFVFLSLC